MRFWLFGFLMVALIFSIPAFAAEENAPAAGEENSDIPSQTDMSLEFNGALPATFRGGDPDSERVHVLEDRVYRREEHSLIYDGETGGDAAGLGDGAKFKSDPVINWSLENVSADGTVGEPADMGAANEAAADSEFPNPGEYRVGNGGAREVGGSGGGAEGNETPGEDEEAGTGAGGTGDETPGDDEVGGTGAGGTGDDQPGGEGVTRHLV